MSTACFTGHRPDKLGGYDWSTNKNQCLLRGLMIAIKYLIIEKNINQFMCGGALGIDQMTFEIISYFKRQNMWDGKLILAIPFEDQPIKWISDVDKSRYGRHLSLADEKIYVDTLEKYTDVKSSIGRYSWIKMTNRNKYMVDNSDILISIWNGDSEGGTYNCLSYAVSSGRNIINIRPDDLLNITSFKDIVGINIMKGRVFGERANLQCLEICKVP